MIVDYLLLEIKNSPQRNFHNLRLSNSTQIAVKISLKQGGLSPTSNGLAIEKACAANLNRQTAKTTSGETRIRRVVCLE